MNKWCPLFFANNDLTIHIMGNNQYCIKEKCAWWNEDREICAILAIGKVEKNTIIEEGDIFND